MSLYDDLGGEAAISAAVEIFYTKVLADDRINSYFEGIDMDKQIAKQKAFLTMAFGGPNKYTGRSLREAHKNLKGLNDSHVDAVIENLGATLQELGVADQYIQQVADAANGLRKDILNQ